MSFDLEGSHLITVSRLRCLGACPYQHYGKYECGLTSINEKKALRIGRVFHQALDARALGANLEKCWELIKGEYTRQPDNIDHHDWEVELQILLNLFSGYCWKWDDDDAKIQIIQSEKSFQLPIVNPETGAQTQAFKSAGKSDKIIKRPDGKVGIREHKTTKDDISPDSTYWRILSVDPQPAHYFIAHPEAQFVEYDVIRKPSIRPSQIPLLDDAGLKIVRDEKGERVFLEAKGKSPAKPRQSGDKDRGWILATRIESPEEFGARLLADIEERPDFYFTRVEIPILLADTEEFREDLWQGQQMLRHRQKNGFWNRTPSVIVCNQCDLQTPCFAKIPFDGAEPPVGFVRRKTMHQELEFNG